MVNIYINIQKKSFLVVFLGLVNEKVKLLQIKLLPTLSDSLLNMFRVIETNRNEEALIVFTVKEAVYIL